MFLLCERMRWNFLPVAGGLYDQDPELIRKFTIIFQLRAEHEERERKKQEQQQRRGKPSVAGRRR